MDCCGQGLTFVPRHWVWSTTLTPVGAMLAGAVGPRGSTTAAQTAETASAALEVLRKSVSVDVHSHGGKTGITSKSPPNDELANAMRVGSLAIGAQRAFWPPRARPSPASFIGTISSVWLG